MEIFKAHVCGFNRLTSRACYNYGSLRVSVFFIISLERKKVFFQTIVFVLTFSLTKYWYMCLTQTYLIENV